MGSFRGGYGETLGCVRKLGSIVNGSMAYFTDPYKWGIPWGYNPLILTFDPNFLGHPDK